MTTEGIPHQQGPLITGVSGLSASSFAFNRSINPLTAIPERYRDKFHIEREGKTKHLIAKNFVMTLLETDQSEASVLTTESKHEARGTQQYYKRTKV